MKNVGEVLGWYWGGGGGIGVVLGRYWGDGGGIGVVLWRYWEDRGGMDPWIILISILVARHASSVLLWKSTIKANTRSLLKDYRTNREQSCHRFCFS